MRQTSQLECQTTPERTSSQDTSSLTSHLTATTSLRLTSKMTSLAQLLSVDLKSSALHELEFLKRVRQVQILKDPEILKIVHFRLEKLWFPLLKKFSRDSKNDLDYLPPLDVHWMWWESLYSLWCNYCYYYLLFVLFYVDSKRSLADTRDL